jgi:hypothetical protein
MKLGLTATCQYCGRQLVSRFDRRYKVYHWEHVYNGHFKCDYPSYVSDEARAKRGTIKEEKP